MLSHELRKLYIDFFVGKDHLHLPGAPVVPVDHLGREDRSTLYTSAGMQQFKPYFTGEAAPPKSRIVTVQKCVRTGDIESVGDMSHCTFFEMLGNFSFGDYFKAEVIPWTWEFLTERLRFDGDRLCVTVFLDDDEAFEIWHDVVGLPEDRIHRLGEDKNYWPANAISVGPNGPCGPCTEVFYRVADTAEMCSDAGLAPTERYKVDDDAGRWLEVWNNVFTQFDRREGADGSAVLQPLPNKNNDTGAGFERLTCLMQGVTSVFDSDLFAPAVDKLQSLSGRRYSGGMSREDVAFRVAAEHIRTAVFCLADGVLPSNEGRGYVLRRVMRRAIRLAKSALGFERPFTHEVAPAIQASMGGHYTEIVERGDHILAALQAEEERFRRTLDNGMLRLDEVLASDDVRRTGTISGTDAFVLYDTFGFPLQLTEEIASERGIAVDQAGFDQAMADQRERSREATGIEKDVFSSLGAALAELNRTVDPTAFTGYGDTALNDARVLAIVHAGELVDFCPTGYDLEVVLDCTPFYAESGGQVGDHGLLTCGGVSVDVTGVRRAAGVVLHSGRVTSGELTVGATVLAQVDLERRRDIMRNHTATHLLQSALRQVLGAHVHQKGSLVAPDRLRFDFTHSRPVGDDEIRAVEDIVNAHVLADLRVTATDGVPISEARSRGAMALFGEKYGDSVRVVEVGNVSLELCGGTHLTHTSAVGLFKIVSETGVAAGVRRIEAVTGAGAWRWVKDHEDELRAAARLFKAGPRDVSGLVEKLMAQRSALEKQVQQLRSAGGAAAEVSTTMVRDAAVVTSVAPNADADALAALADRLGVQHGSCVVVVGSALDGKALFASKVSADLVARGAHAGNIIREVARAAGGGGGGRPDFAQAGGRDPAKVADALAVAVSVLEGQLK